ncbi:hypothetical protein D3C81_769110 [compost metagenome]
MLRLEPDEHGICLKESLELLAVNSKPSESPSALRRKNGVSPFGCWKSTDWYLVVLHDRAPFGVGC